MPPHDEDVVQLAQAGRPAPLVETRVYQPEREWHRHGYHQVLFGLDGACELEIGGHLHRLDPCGGLIVPAGERHDFLGLDDNRQLVLDIPPGSLALPAALMDRPKAFAITGGWSERVRRLAALPQATSSRQHHWQLAATLAADLAQALDVGSRARPAHFPLAQIDACLRQHLDAPLRADQLAARFGWSVRRFHTLFCDAFGDTPHRYQTRLRLDQAARLLADRAQPLADISLALGFPDQTTFTRSFTQRFGMPPGAWRAGLGLANIDLPPSRQRAAAVQHQG
ncbi:helix-turn-helix transcriptional regulator [Cupriavidus basilensis]|uniref:helix-turn-helix transcriptional regulator n=1 Tax=Cupriavidus basilensis TaxID=68895 RepID=UPI0028445A69|nr:AraC family transcriptional regulator [Cupriavidus basilensis]MDR3383861.1 AraC family transcriptional regulator [Cupriavidus basilensis]